MVIACTRDDAGVGRIEEYSRLLSPDGEVFARTFRYGTADTAITQVVVDFPDTRGCSDSAATFYGDDVDLKFDWLDNRTLLVRFPEGERFDHPPWGTTVRCVTETVEIRMMPY